MARALIALVLGVLLGVTVTVLLRPATLALPDLGEPRAPVTTSPPADAVVSAAAREGGPDFYRRLADANAGDLASLIRQAAAEPASTDRDLALAVSLKRYSELDALGAVRLAREAGVGGMALSAVYGAWARAAPGQALAALSTVESPEAAATVAIALIAALGNDAAAFGRVAAVLAAREEDEPSASVAMPAVPPFVAPGAAIASAAPRSALALAAQRWADLDPRRAFAAVREIDDERVRLSLEMAALRALARVAPDEVFTHLATVSAESQRAGMLAGTYMELARTNPERLLASVRHLPQELRRIAELVAVQQLADRDPVAAAQYLESMPPGQERQRFTQVIARAYGKHDAAAALAWARSLPERDNLIGAVLGGVAEQDPHRALDLALELTAPRERMQAIQFVAMTSTRDDATAEAIANRLLRLDDRRLRASMAFSVVAGWAQRSPESAMRWLLANVEAAPPNVFMQMGQQIAMRDPRNAVARTGQIPAEAREQWMQGVAQGYAQSDPRGALDWIAQFRGEPWYDGAAMRVAEGLAERDGAAAVRLVEELDAARAGGGQTEQLLNGIVTRWANHDPAAAADWAMNLGTERERTMAMRNVVGIWSNQDPAGARQWTMRLPQGTTRDGALATVLLATAFQGSGSLDLGLLNAFASDSARQQAVMQVVQGLAYRDPVEARAVIDAYVTDPPLRAQAERVLEAARNDANRRPAFGIQFGTR